MFIPLNKIPIKLSNKTILIISPQPWGTMRVTKHHYAENLAKLGAKVFFLSTPTTHKISLKPPAVSSTEIDNLKIIEYKLFFSYKIKFKNENIFHWLMKIHVRRIEKLIKQKIDIVWSFDLGNFYPFKIFANNPVKIYMPVDEPLHRTAFASGIGANILFSVTKEIIEKYSKVIPSPGYFLNHGLNNVFINHEKSITSIQLNKRIAIGISGNFLRPDIDYTTLVNIVQQNFEIDFHFWGQSFIGESNYSNETNAEIDNYIVTLKNLSNTIFHGICNQKELAKGLHSVDGFLICYDIKKDYSRGTNYHKILEYLSTGKVIIANNVSTYKDNPELVSMIKSREDNNELPAFFKTIMNNLANYNSKENQQARIDYATNQSYPSQIKKINDLLILHNLI